MFEKIFLTTAYSLTEIEQKSIHVLEALEKFAIEYHYVAKSMEEQLFALCREWKTEDISDFGAFWYVENTDDLDNYHITGMTERIESATPEWITVLVSSNGERCQQVCHVIDDALAIYVFCEEKYLSGFAPQPINN